MKYIITLLTIPALYLSGCCQTPQGTTKFPCFTGNQSCFLRMAFGNAIRSLEGSKYAQDATKIPAAIQALAAAWLPANEYTAFINGITAGFVAAHPVTVDQVNKVLEALATQVQTGC